jgi:hypothetical protein
MSGDQAAKTLFNLAYSRPDKGEPFQGATIPQQKVEEALSESLDFDRGGRKYALPTVS